MKKKHFTFSNIFTIVFIAGILVLLFNPNAKARVIETLMQIGLFQPDVPEKEELEDLNAVNNLQANNIYFKDIHNRVVNLNDEKGKVIFINFWATWCPPCIAEMPSLQKLYQQFYHNNKVLFLMVDVDNDERKAQAFMKKHGYTFPLFTIAGSIPDDYYSGTLPTTVIINTTGKVVYRHEGAADYSNPKIAGLITDLMLK